MWHLSETLTPAIETDSFNQAMMDLGATVCTRSKPSCELCPVEQSCLAKAGEQQMNFPQKKPKKKIPEKQTIMVIPRLKNERCDKVLMEKRPPAGIWGGLWCFHEVDEQSEIDDLMADLSLKVLSSQTLTEFRHTFSHFHLDITPVIVDCQQLEVSKINEPNQQKWYDLHQGLSVGLAASTQKLLTLLRDC